MQNEYIFDVVRDAVSEVCGVPSSEIDGTTDFFELGFHSLLITQLVARLEDKFDMDFSIRDFFTTPCVNGIVVMIESKLTESI
jgi:acyl carrier protein